MWDPEVRAPKMYSVYDLHVEFGPDIIWVPVVRVHKKYVEFGPDILVPVVRAREKTL